MMSGLRHLDTNQSRYGHQGGGSYEKNIDKYVVGTVKKPYYIFFSNIDMTISYIEESLKLISDKYIVISQSEIDENDIIINNFGEIIYDNVTHLSPESYVFIRNLFLDKIKTPNSKFEGKKYFIRRDKSHLLPGNEKENYIKRRQIINENELSNSLNDLGFESIYLEDYSFIDKITIFNQSSVIVSPNSGALTFSIFSSQLTKIFEINTEFPSQISNQYKSQCDSLKIPYFKFISNKLDDNDNMIVDIDKIKEILNNI
jgi:hypothetical protein